MHITEVCFTFNLKFKLSRLQSKWNRYHTIQYKINSFKPKTFEFVFLLSALQITLIKLFPNKTTSQKNNFSCSIVSSLISICKNETIWNHILIDRYFLFRKNWRYVYRQKLKSPTQPISRLKQHFIVLTTGLSSPKSLSRSCGSISIA